MLRPFTMTLALLALVLAGCLVSESPPTTQSTTTSTSPESSGFSVPNNATGCLRTLIAVFMEKDHAQSRLPEGYAAADASEFFGAPPGSNGRGVALVSVMECQTSQTGSPYGEAAVGIFVKAPSVPGLEPTPSNVYDLGRAARNGTVADLMGRLQWPYHGDVVNMTFKPGPLAMAEGRAGWTNEPWLEFQATGTPASDSFTEHIRWFHAASNGTAFFEYSFTVDGNLGTGTCDVAKSPWAQDSVGGSACPQGSLFMVGPAFDFQGEFRWMPGVVAKSA